MSRAVLKITPELQAEWQKAAEAGNWFRKGTPGLVGRAGIRRYRERV
ncbi:MAG: hypothetical protein HFI63_05515 [Lachnospiraceae bacterium]|nr:hypothetical protein [Lachnospiraceae bacterium]